MKQLYESEVLFQLMERDGFNIPSSVPPYEAEIKAYLINQVKQAYPKLTDYEAEWLLYNYTKHLPAEFPISTVKNTSYAHFENVVPFAYQSAILKGNTLVNLASNNYVLKNASKIENGFKFDGKTSNSDHTLTFQVQAKSDTYYTYIFNSDTAFEFMSGYDATDNDGWVQPSYRAIIGLNVIKVKTEVNNENKNLAIRTTSNRVGNKNVLLTNFMLLEGDYTSVDIPYFTGMQSVKMPVLTTTGKNLFDKDNVNHISGFISSNKTIVSTNNVKAYYIKCKSNTNYTISKIKSNYFRFASTNSEPIGGSSITTFVASDTNTSLTITTGLSDNYLCFNVHDDSIASDITEEEILNSIQIEEGSQATPYEPYKSNILTANEPVELRGIGDVQDELNCLTGEVTERIGEFIITNDYSWYSIKENENTIYAQTTLPTELRGLFFKNMSNKPLMCDKIKYIGNSSDEEHIRFTTPSDTLYSDNINIWLNKNKLTSYDSDGINQYIQSIGGITVQGALVTEVIKTVDLTTLNESGETVYFMPLEGIMNVSSSSETIQPTFDMNVPVEATTQNLASFIDMEMEE